MKKQPRPHIPDTAQREALLHRIERLTEELANLRQEIASLRTSNNGPDS